jgi:uncharacterized RDD family membrane protein YckC
MQMTTDARTWLAATVRRILARHPLGDAERAGATYELMSHLHAAGEARATAAGRLEVTREDLAAAVAAAGGDDALAAAFVQPLARPAGGGLLGRRLGAFAIDMLLLVVVLTLVHGLVVLLLTPLMGGMGSAANHGLGGTGSAAGRVDFWWPLMPWGYHDPTLALVWQAIIALASAATVLGYFAWFEGYAGRSPGKRLLNLRVVRVDGRPMTYRSSLIRNLVKVAPLLLFLDTLLMLTAFGADKQRASDKIAETIVIRA